MREFYPKIQLQEMDKKFIWHPFTQMKDWLKEEPLIITEGDGVYLIDIDGRRYIDGVSSIWINVHGHRNSYLDKAIINQLKKIAHTTFLGLTHPPAILLAKKLVEIAPRGLTKVFYSDSGSEAVEIALKMAFQYWQQVKGPGFLRKKVKFVCLEEAYHGDTIGSVSVGGIDLFHKIYKPLLFRSYKVPAPYCYRCRWLEKCSWECIEKLESVLKKHSSEVAGLIIEPLVQGAAGMIVHPLGYLKKVRELCDKYNVLLIADEVATGIGRTGTMFACEKEGVVPDIMAVAKGISGGYLPVAATLVKKKIYKAFLAPYKEKKTFFHGHTYTANPLGCSVCIANIELFQKKRVLEKLQPKIAFLKDRLREFYALKHVGDVRQCGFMVGIELVKDKEAKTPYLWEEEIGIKVILEARKRGVIIRPLGNVIVLMPPLVISKKDLSTLLDVLYDSIKTVTEK